MVTMPLFYPQDLSAFVQDDVDPVTATQIERVVWGWLQPALGLAERPAEVSPQVFSWAIELAAIARENPTGLAAYQLGPERWQYSTERRTEILSEAEASTGSGSGSIPRGSFPPAQSWPDPIRPRWTS